MFFPSKGVNFSLQQYLDHEARIAKGKPKAPSNHAPAERETGKDGLHAQIMEYCDQQWPRWKYIHARTDLKSTISVGAPDFFLLLPTGKTLIVECKAKGGKPTPEQLSWKVELERLGHTMHFIWSFAEFRQLIEPNKKPPGNQPGGPTMNLNQTQIKPDSAEFQSPPPATSPAPPRAPLPE